MSNWWHERNAIREGEQRRSAAYLASLCRKQTQELKALHGPMQAMNSSMQRVGSAGSRARKWQRPSSGSLKINVDGSFRVADRNGGWGYVIRDDMRVELSNPVSDDNASLAILCAWSFEPASKV